MPVDQLEKVIKLLKENTVMALATSFEDRPRSSIMEYVMVGDTMVFMTDPGSIKGKNLAKNKRVSLTVGKVAGDIMKVNYVAIDGTVTDANQNEIDGYNVELFKRYPMFKDMMSSGEMKYKYFRVQFATAYYSSGMAPAEVIKF